jgi:glycosyltransferase involved in cell wall biosynthesis
MRILLVTHGFPPEQRGGVELHTQALAGELARLGHSILVVSGTLRSSQRPGEIEVLRGPPEGVPEEVPEEGASYAVVRLARGDLYFDHWHKSLCLELTTAFRALVREFRPDVVHVQHWLRLSRDLVLAAAREGVPAVVSLHDAWASCPIAFRVRPLTREPCDAVVGPHPCVACAGRLPPRTPWVPVEAGFLQLAERQRDLVRELELARVLVAPSQAHGLALERWLGREPGSLSFEVLAPCAALPAPREALPDPADSSPIPYLYLATWCQIAPHKGLDVLLEGLRLARSELAAEAVVFLDIHGEPADPEYAARLEQQSADEPVRWRGPFAPADLPLRIAPEVQVFVGASRAHESYGIAADEAARLGLALVLPDAPAFRERFSAVAEFHAQGNAQALAEVLVGLARDRRRLARARRLSREHGHGLATAGPKALRHLEFYQRAILAGAPSVSAEGWYEARMNRAALADWDRALSARSREELGT